MDRVFKSSQNSPSGRQTLRGAQKLSLTAVFSFAGAAQIFLAAPASAQSLEQMMQQNMEESRAVDAQLNAHMQQAEQNVRNTTRLYIDQNRPRLEREHRQYMAQTGARLSLEDFVGMQRDAEAARRNAAAAPTTNPMFEQQKRMFEAGQRAHQARQQSNDAYNQNWAQGQQQIEINNQNWSQGQRQIDSNNARFIQQGIQGNQYYQNTETGQVTELPFANSPGVYRNEGTDSTYTSGQMGEYQQLGPQGQQQDLEQYEPEYYGEAYYGEEYYGEE